MFNFCVLVGLLIFFKFCEPNPFILQKSLNYCAFNLSTNNENKSAVTFTSKIWKVQTQDIIIYYTLCGHLPEEINCGINAAACLIDKYNSSYIIGKKIILEDNSSYTGNSLLLNFVSGDTCKTNSKEKYRLTVKFKCDSDMKETYLEEISKCEFNIYMVHPNCSLPCTTKIDGQLIDLRALKGNYLIEENGKKFSISLCNATPNCVIDRSSNISICEKLEGGIIAISSFSNERIIYNLYKNELVYRGSHKGERGLKRFELLFKCDWENNVTQIKHKKVPIQGKDYKFIMDSSYGCIKLPPKCVITDKSWIYNLTNISNTDGYLVSNVPNSTIYINVCGPLNFKLKPNNPCSSSFSQVCELRNGTYVNRGSILSKFEVFGDTVRVTYTNGITCKEDPSRQYSTHIDFFCSNKNDGPTFVKFDKCDLFLSWTTSEACPIYESNCESKRHKEQDCSTVLEGQNYDLSFLKQYNSNYEIISGRNNNIKYFLNVCGLVIDNNIPCFMKDSMVVMQDLETANVKYRFKSLGKMDAINIISDDIVLEAVSGTYCGPKGDYTSSLHLICSNVEEPPRLVNNTECTFQFEMRTPYACRDKPHSKLKQCLIKDSSSNILLDFSKSKHSSLKINLNEISYVFNFCEDNYTECLENDQCKNLPVTKQVSSPDGNSTYFQLSLPKTCDSRNTINKVIFELICDEIGYNEHFKLQDPIDNCTVKFYLYTNLVCDIQGHQMANENDKYNILKENAEGNCLIINHVTDYKINISSLHLNIPFEICPTVLFYERNSTVVLVYPKNGICNSSTKNVYHEYKVILTCSNEVFHDVMKQDCLALYHIRGPEFCKLFESSTLDIPHKKTYTVTVIVSLVIGTLIVLCGFGFYKWRRYLWKSRYLTIYERDTGL